MHSSKYICICLLLLGTAFGQRCVPTPMTVCTLTIPDLDIPAELEQSQIERFPDIRDCKEEERVEGADEQIYTCPTTIIYIKSWVCEDKTRILLPDRTDLNKYWCHKPDKELIVR